MWIRTHSAVFPIIVYSLISSRIQRKTTTASMIKEAEQRRIIIWDHDLLDKLRCSRFSSDAFMREN